MAPYCAIPRDYLSDTPLLRAMGFLVSQHGQLGAIPPPPFLTISPLQSTQNGGAIPPHKRGISAILARYPMKTKEMRAIPPLCDTISKGYCAIRGGISHWAAKPPSRMSLYRANGRSHSGGQTAEGDSKASPRLKRPLFAAPALREIESACRVSTL